MAKTTIHCFISGKVQGVFFRYSTRVQANSLKITGWVRNLTDGRVELIASGEQDKIEQLFNWLQKGPANANVSNVERHDLEYQQFDQFESIR